MLKDRIRESGLKMGFLAKQIGITPYSLSRKVAGKSPFKEREIAVLCKYLAITADEFFVLLNSQTAN